MEKTPARASVVDQIFGHNKAPVAEVLNADFADLVKEVDGLVANAGTMPKKIKDEADLGMIGNCIVDLRSLKGRVDGHRKDEGGPAFEAKKQIDGFFNDLAEKLAKAGSDLQATADEYSRRKAAEERAKREEEARKARAAEEAERRKAEEAASAGGAARATGRAEHFAAAADAAEKAAGAKASDLTRTRAGGVTSSAKTSWDFVIEDYGRIDLNVLRPYLPRADVEKAIRSAVRVQKGDTAILGVRVFQDTKASFRR